MTGSTRKSMAETWTTRRLLEWIGRSLGQAGVESPRLCAELLVSHVLGCDRLRLYADSDRPASADERDRLRGLVARALRHEPVQYLVGEGWFFSLPFTVDTRVLIPRPETETIVEAVLQAARTRKELASGVIADIGTGSGCIIIAILKNLPGARGVALDISADALDVARINAQRHGVLDRLDLLRGDLLEPMDDHPCGRRLAALVSNPPYIPDHEWDAVPANVKQEPLVALRGGADGLDFVRRIVREAPGRLVAGGLLAVEIAESTAPAALELVSSTPGLTEARIERDFQGRPRTIIARRDDTPGA